MISEYQQKIIDNLPEERRLFMEKQKNAFPGFMEGNYFMGNDGYCYRGNCRADVIKHEMENGNDGSRGVTGCHHCHRSYCD